MGEQDFIQGDEILLIEGHQVGRMSDLPLWAQSYIRHLWKSMGLKTLEEISGQMLFDPEYEKWLDKMHENIGKSIDT